MKRKKTTSSQQLRNVAMQAKWQNSKKPLPKDINHVTIHKKRVHIGGKHRNTYGPYVKDILESNFTSKELNEIDNLYIETNPLQMSKNCSGTCEELDFGKGIKGSIIRIPKVKQGNIQGGEDTLTHETIHALRFTTNRNIRDNNRNEKETQLESLSRISFNGLQKMTTGYYDYIPELKTVDERFIAIDDDRVLLNKTLKRKQKGKYALRTVNKNYRRSQLSKARFSPGENIDRYFFVKTSTGLMVKVHKRYKVGKVATVTELKMQFGKRYGPNATVWEWHDGKKKLFLSKKKSVKRNVKKQKKKSIDRR